MTVTNIQSGQARASRLAQQAMEQVAQQAGEGIHDHADSDYARAQQRFQQRREEIRQEGILRGRRHNQELKAQAEIRKYGGFQLDMFSDNDTGLAKAA